MGEDDDGGDSGGRKSRGRASAREGRILSLAGIRMMRDGFYCPLQWNGVCAPCPICRSFPPSKKKKKNRAGRQ